MYKENLIAKCDRFVENHNEMTREERIDLQNEIVRDMYSNFYIDDIENNLYRSYLDKFREADKIDTSFIKNHKDDLFYIVTVSDEFLSPNVFETKFHPSGNTGCIVSNDEYIFGIRCNHLIWIEGWSEVFGSGYFVVGNHKGRTVTKFVGLVKSAIDDDIFNELLKN